ncbi:MAG TPA: hypothetical protein VIJ87_21370, partial [Pyrinomonadaceae bacterium]
MRQPDQTNGRALPEPLLGLNKLGKGAAETWTLQLLTSSAPPLRFTCYSSFASKVDFGGNEFRV